MKNYLDNLKSKIYNPVTISAAISGAVGFATSAIFSFILSIIQGVYWRDQIVYSFIKQSPNIITILFYIIAFVIAAIPYFIAGCMSIWLYQKLKKSLDSKSEQFTTQIQPLYYSQLTYTKHRFKRCFSFSQLFKDIPTVTLIDPSNAKPE